ncbi:MAG: hypothetical protein J6X83_04430 [Methanomicrobium sp.]|nr:hypothetical protein [Methanomicrobium sp.]
MSDGQVVFEVTADGKHVKADIKDITKAIQAESKNWDKSAKDATDSIEQQFGKMAGKIVAKLTALGVGALLVNFGKQAVETASDLAEVQNVVDTVFGDGASKIETWSKKAGSQFGLTELQAKKFTSTLGAMMKSSGLAGSQIVNMSTDLAGLASDMASFYNMDFETAFEKIRSGISGETMPLKQLGINMSVANLEAFALAQGLEKTFSQMDQGEQTMLRYQYLMSVTSDAQGDFAKTADGFANAQKRIQSAITSIQGSVGEIFLPFLADATSGIASFLEGIASSAMPDRTIMDEFNDIEVDTSQKLADLNETYEKAEAIIKLLDEISQGTVNLNNGSTVTFEELFRDLGEVELNGGDIRGYLANLGVDVDAVIQKYNVWKESTRQLTSLVPSLTAQIDSETGAIEGGTDALQANLEQWRQNEEKKLRWTAYYAKERALAEKQANQYLLEFDAGTAKQRVDKARNAMVNVWKASFDEAGNIIDDKLWSLPAVQYEKFRKDAEHYNLLLKEQRDAESALGEDIENNASAVEYLAQEHQKLIDEFGEEEKAYTDLGDASEKYLGKTETEWKTAVSGAEKAKDAIKAVADYYKSVRDSTEQAVNSALKGFDKIAKAGDDLRKTSGELASQETETLNKYSEVFGRWGSDNDSLRNMAKSWDSLTDAEQEAYNALAKIRNEQREVNDALNQYKPEGMKKNLQDQIAYMEEYLANLNQLKEWGVSEELIASLSDGSKESAEFLNGLVEGGKEASLSVGDLYEQVQVEKQNFTDALTAQKLAVDETYGSLVDTARETMDALDFGEEARDASASVVLNVAEGISSNIPAVASAVNSLIAVLDPLGNLGFDWGYGGGKFHMNLYNPIDGSFETGLDRVPFDGFLASLHEGEGILTAEENRIWQNFKNGQPKNSIDYDTIGGVVRDNVPTTGGNVYLDGRTVGQVISAQQANSYRQLTRSGWMG